MSNLADIDLKPWVLAVLLAAAFAGQIALPGPMPDIAPEARIRPRFGAQAPSPPIPAYPEISRQMIFTPDRARGGSPSAADGPPTLVGVAAMGAHISTVLRTLDGADHVVEVGGEVAGWRLVSAGDDHAVLRRGDTTLTVHLGAALDAQPAAIDTSSSDPAGPMARSVNPAARR